MIRTVIYQFYLNLRTFLENTPAVKEALNDEERVQLTNIFDKIRIKIFGEDE